MASVVSCFVPTFSLYVYWPGGDEVRPVLDARNRWQQGPGFVADVVACEKWIPPGPLRMCFVPLGADLFRMLYLAPSWFTGGVFGSFTQRVYVPFFGVLVVGGTPSKTYQPFDVAFSGLVAPEAD